jgi:hypothetical protein
MGHRGRADQVAIETACYSPELRRSVIDLQRLLWSSDPALNDAYFAWKYESNPYIGEPLFQLAYRGRELVGVRGTCGTAWQAGAGDTPIVVPYPDDFVIAPHARNSGVFREIMRASIADLASRGHAYVLNLSAGRVTAFGSLQAGWRRVFGMAPFVRRSSSGEIRRGLRRRVAARRFLWRLEEAPAMWSRRERHPFAQLDRRGSSAEDAGDPVRLRRSPEPGRMAALVSCLAHDGRLRHVRDERYLTWRYANPVSEYRFLLWGEEPLEGYLVLQRYRTGHPSPGRVNVVDWEAASDRVLHGLLSRAVAWGDCPTLVCWTATLPAARLAALDAFEFRSEPVNGHHETSLLVRCTDERPAEEWQLGDRPLLDPASWDLRMVYSMAG